jgi:hypothetical protein
MGLIVKLRDDKTNTDYWMEWSTICDAPLTHGFSLAFFIKYYKEKYGTNGMEDLPDRLERVERYGCSDRLDPENSLRSLIASNRAGKNEARLTLEEILDQYCRSKIEH